MIFELLHAPFPEGYGDELLPLAECKAHLRVTSEDEDDLISILRDAAIEFVEQYCSIRLGVVAGLVWRAERLPSHSTAKLLLGISPVASIQSVEWSDLAGAPVFGDPEDYRITSHGEVLPVVSGSWPVGVGGGVTITFTAGYEPGQAPRSLLMAAKMFLGHLWSHREAVIDSGTAGEVPFGVNQLCSPFRSVLI